MKRLIRLLTGVALAPAAVGFHVALMAQAVGTNDHWVATWATSVSARPQAPPAPPVLPPGQAIAPQAPAPLRDPQAPYCQQLALATGRGAQPPALNFRNQTLRQVVHVSLGGDRVRVVFSNEFGTMPLEIGAAHVARRDMDAALRVGSDRALTFNGRPSTIIPAGTSVISDPVNLAVPALSDLVVDIYLPGDTAVSPSPLTTHVAALETNYVSAEGNHAGDPALPGATHTQAWFFLARVEVMASGTTGTIVTLGDSITDGTRSTPGTNSRWPDQLARRFVAQRTPLGVLNEGIAGNRVLCDGAGVNALARFDRDVLAQTGAKYVVVLEGINDIGFGLGTPVPSAADLIAAHRQLIERAHAAGLTIFGATLTPFEGFFYFTREGEAKRAALNEFIRTGKAYDGVIDFDLVVRDPAAPTRLQKRYDSGDNLHPNDAGYAAMANAIDLRLFTPSTPPR